MNFLTSSGQMPTSGQPHVHEVPSEAQILQKPTVTLEGLFSADIDSQFSSSNSKNAESHGFEVQNGDITSSSSKYQSLAMEDHMNVTEDDGWITIPYKVLPDKWEEASNISLFGSLDRPFVFSGEQLHLLACLSSSKQDVEIITPFRVAAMMSKNGVGRSTRNEDGCDQTSSTFSGSRDSRMEGADFDSKATPHERIDSPEDASVSESIIRMEDHKRKTEALLQRLRNSRFLVRIAKSGGSDCSGRDNHTMSFESSTITGTNSIEESDNAERHDFPSNAVTDGGNHSAGISGGMARMVKCCSLSNGDVVVLLQVNIGADSFSDSVLEIVQFEKFQDMNFGFHHQGVSQQVDDPCSNLLQWLLPVDNVVPPSRPFSPPPFGSSSAISSASQRTNLSTSGSQLFSFGHFRSYSMSSLPQLTALSSSLSTPSTRSKVDLEDWDRFSSQKPSTVRNDINDGLLSFRGIPLEPERFTVQCGLEGIYIPGRRWRRNIEIIQPVEIHSFSADCNTDDILSVQVKNVAPDHLANIIMFIDSISIVYDESSKGIEPIALPVACIEAGDGYSLPNLPLRRDEEHSFIVKLSTSTNKMNKFISDQTSKLSHIHHGKENPSLSLSKTSEGRTSNCEGYAVIVSCRSNFTESRLFFKKATSWKPRKPRDLMVSIMSDVSRQTIGSGHGGFSELPLQVLTLQATNLTMEDLTLTVLAPASVTSPPSVMSLSSSPSSPVSPFIGFSDSALHQVRPACDGTKEQFQNSDFCCTHLWLQSRVPLGRVPSRSTTTIKLELLPLTDGIITLDTLQIEVREKGLTYVPEDSLMISATSTVSSGIA